MCPINNDMYKVKVIEIEVTTICNAYCPICIRYDVQDDGLYVNALANINQKIDISMISTILDSDEIADNVRIDLVGTSGEPLAHPNILDIISEIRKYRPSATFNIHTNGGLKTPAFFRKLGELLADTRHRVCFSLDGLEDTNKIYRIGVDWHKSIDNMKAFIAGGGEALWQMVLFDWNEHQMEDCKNLAFELGCYSFETRENVDPDAIGEAIESANKNIFNKIYENSNNDLTDFLDEDYDYIDDQCIQDEGIFISPSGLVFPCCMFYASLSGPERHWITNIMYSKYGEEWNDLNHNSMTDILLHPWWNELHDSIKNNPCNACISQCGTKEGSRSSTNIEEITYDRQ